MMDKKDEVQATIFAITDVLAWSPKNDRHSLEHPFFSLWDRRDTRPRFYVSPNGQAQIKITPSVLGHPTVMDQDLLIYAATLIRDAMTRGCMGETNTSIVIPTYNFLAATGRSQGGKAYKLINDLLRRLKGAQIETNIETSGVRVIEGFGLIDSYKIKVQGKDGKILAFELKVSDWLYRAIWNANKELLTLNREYFSLRSSLERRLYQIARKHCGAQDQWSIDLSKLHYKAGSNELLRKFRAKVRKIAEEQNLPDYLIFYKTEGDQVAFILRKSEKAVQTLLDLVI